jgi:hypothetical protein
MAKTTGFEAIRHDVWQSIIDVTNNYGLLAKVIFPITNQRETRRDYPFITYHLVQAVAEHVLLAVCRLFDTTDDSRHVCLMAMLRGVHDHHADDVDVAPHKRELRVEFERALATHCAGIEKRWKVLVRHRSGYLAHRDLTKLDTLPEIKYLELKADIALAQQIYEDYSTAFTNAPPQRWDLNALDTEPADFLEWCRLDDYKRHGGDQRKAFRRKHNKPGEPGGAPA